MTENKRFMIIGENYTNIDMPVFVVCRENDCCFEVYESKEEAQRVCDKLNNLLDENKTLKEENKKLKNMVRHNYVEHKRCVNNYVDKIKEVEKENEQLKNELKIYRNVANCGNCKYHNYDWFDDGDEFEVCQKGHELYPKECKDFKEL